MADFLYFRLFCTICSLWLVCSCSNRDSWLGTREVHNDVVFLENPGIGLWDDSKEFVLIPDLSLDASSIENDAKLLSVYDLDVDSQGNMYVCDYKANMIKIYCEDGTFASCIESRENKSDKLEGPTLVKVNSNGMIAVYESGRREISLFTNEGIFLHSFDPELGAIQSMEFNDSSHIFLSTLELQFDRKNDLENPLNRSLSKYNLQGRLIQRFSESFLIKQHKNLVNPYSVTYINLLQNGNLLCAFHYPYLLRIYTPSGKLQKAISKKNESNSGLDIVRVPILPFDSYMLMTQTNIIATYELPDGKLFVHIIDKGSTYINDFQAFFKARLIHKNLDSTNPSVSHYYDLFDKNGYFLQSFTLDSLNQGVIKFVDKKGRIYIRSYDQHSNTYRLIRYRYEFKDKKPEHPEIAL